MSDARARSNSFDQLRLAAAFLVLVGHSYVLTGHQAPIIFGRPFHVLGIEVFFAISGFLIAESIKRDRHPVRFFAKRALRILPALWAATVVTILCCAFVSTLPVGAYLTHPTTLDFTNNLLLNIRFVLPGVFVQSPVNQAVNGSWWSLPVEVLMYVGLYLSMLLGARTGAFFAVVIYAAASAVVQQGLEFAAFGAPIGTILAVAIFFVAGAVMAAFEAPLSTPFAACLVVFSSLLPGYWQAEFMPAAITYAVVCIGSEPDRLPWLRRYLGDSSYGVYLYAFLVQQLVVAWMPAIGPIEHAIAASVATLPIALLSWRLVEEPSLRLKPRSSPSVPRPAVSAQGG